MSCIRVICRVRPENKIEQESGAKNCVFYTEDSVKIIIFDRSEEQHEFTFDKVCGSEAHQLEVFVHAAKPVVEGVLDGYNGTIFAYGQTGSGKTYTMEGLDITNEETKGIIPRMMDSLFEGLINASESIEFTLRVSFLEIYLERIHDLLDSNKANLQVKEDKLRGIYVHNASEVYVSSPEEMMKIMKKGSANRSIAATRMNERSSRSHSIFCVNVEQRDLQGNKKSGRLYFVDLAGSESVGKTNASGQQLKEAMMINKSLSALGNVINALSDKGDNYIPYRDSKLTRILQESIGGNSQTSLIIACSMSSYNDKETLSTLRFGQRAKKIQNKPVVNQERSSKELIKQVGQLQNELKKQAEIINSIHRHLQIKYSIKNNLVEEIEDIINNCFETVPIKNSERQGSEYALTLLKQHIEIVKVHEELQTVKIEKKEIEDELNYRNKEIAEFEIQNCELQQFLLLEKNAHAASVEDLQGQLDRVAAETQNSSIKAAKVFKVCERLKSDLSIISKEIPKTEQWSEILVKSIHEALLLLTSIFEFPNSNDFFINTTDSPFESLQLLDSQAQLALLSEKFQIKSNEAENFLKKINDKDIEIENLKSECELLSRQLDTKVKNIEEERASVAIEMKFKDLQIEDLKKSLINEKEKFEILKSNTPQIQENDTQDRLDELCNERRKLFEEIVSLRRDLDLREEQLHNALQKNKRLERQILIQNNKTSGLSRALSPTFNNGSDETLTMKISKPIRGGGGDVSNFQRNNQIINFSNDSLIKNRKNIEKITTQETGLQSMFKGLFGGLLG